MLPDTRYAKKGDAHIAYQVVGESSVDLVLVSTVGAGSVMTACPER